MICHSQQYQGYERKVMDLTCRAGQGQVKIIEVYFF
jgi:hypothetical protein